MLKKTLKLSKNFNIMSETRGQYLKVLKIVYSEADSVINAQGSSIIYELMKSLKLSREGMDKMNLVKLTNAIHDKINEMEGKAKDSPTYLDEPILDSELIDVNKLNLYPLN